MQLQRPESGGPVKEDDIKAFFKRYESCFNQALTGDVDLEQVVALYASDFIAASPAGVMTGKNGDQLKQVMAQGYARYRKMGTKEMRLGIVRVSSIDAQHCMAHVAWSAVYSRAKQSDVAIDFEVHYFVQVLEGKPQVFGWVSGDEQALLKEHGIIDDSQRHT
jgi:hypothetical protein